MQEIAAERSRARTLPIILIAALAQGWGLYFLDLAIRTDHWPATDPEWLIGLDAVAIFAPMTVQLLVEHARRTSHWVFVGLMAAATFYFGWHYGTFVENRATLPWHYFSLGFVLTVLWLLVLPFAQSALDSGWLNFEYRSLFTNAWRNKIALAEAAIFTGLFWLLLSLWESLFQMLGIYFFKSLFDEPVFAYPVTTLVFGCALHLIGSIDRLVSAVLEQILNVLKWLATVSGLMLALFTIALALDLPVLVSTGHWGLSATWLLWLVAVMVLLLNAAYRDGTVERPYPKWIAFSLRLVVPLMVVISFTALFALIIRTRHYGLTVERIWAFIVAGAALMYSVGYSIAAVGRGKWLTGVARVNVFVAIALIATIAATLTGLFSPYRLSADSQYRLALEEQFETTPPQNSFGPLDYLRFNSGRYGRIKLQELTELRNHPNAEHIRELAAETLNKQFPGESKRGPTPEELLAKAVIYPVGRTIDKNLVGTLVNDMQKPDSGFAHLFPPDIVGIYADLNGDGQDEFVLLTYNGGLAFEDHDGQWQFIGQVFRHSKALTWDRLTADLASSNIATAIPRWKQLVVGTEVFTVDKLE